MFRLSRPDACATQARTHRLMRAKVAGILATAALLLLIACGAGTETDASVSPATIRPPSPPPVIATATAEPTAMAEDLLPQSPAQHRSLKSNRPPNRLPTRAPFRFG